jgi:Family of unknown function (DUF5762)
MSDAIWINDFNILFKKDRVMEFFPMKEQSHEERINAIVRLSLYISILLAVYHSNAKYFAIFGFFLVFTSIIYKHHPELNPKVIGTTLQQQTQEKVQKQFLKETTSPQLNNFTPSLGLSNDDIENLENEVRPDSLSATCTKPTLDNPFMNVTMKDYMNLDESGRIVDRPPACDPNDPEIKKMMDGSFNNNLYKDVSDVFGKMSSQRNYFTMPSTTVPNNREAFQKWLYLNPKTCKEDQDRCVNYEDLRSNRFVMPNPEQNPVSSKKLNPANDSNSLAAENAGLSKSNSIQSDNKGAIQ